MVLRTIRNLGDQCGRSTPRGIDERGRVEAEKQHEQCRDADECGDAGRRIFALIRPPQPSQRSAARFGVSDRRALGAACARPTGRIGWMSGVSAIW